MAIYGFVGVAQSGKDTCVKIWQLLDIKKALKDKRPDDVYVKHYLDKPNQPRNMGSAWQKKAFATKLKEIICIITGCTMEQLEDNDFKNSKVPEWMKCFRVVYTDGYSKYTKLFNSKDESSACIDKVYESDGNVISNGVHWLTYRELLQYMGTEVLKFMIHPDIHIHMLLQEYNDANWLISDCRFINEAKAITDRGGKTIKILSPVKGANKHQSETELAHIVPDYLIDNKDYSIDFLIESVKEIMIREGVL